MDRPCAQWRVLLAAALILALPLARAGSRVPAATPEQKGKQIFEKGTSPSGGEIVAVVSGSDVPGSVLPCGSCHGADGKGKPEGGVRPANITWETLAAELAEARPNGRSRPAYDERKLKRAIGMGIDAGGKTLHVAMPRYRMSVDDMANLIAYLKVLGHVRESGLTDSTIDVGLAQGRPDARSRQMLAIVSAYFRDVNERGGIYNRRIKLHVVSAAGEAVDEAGPVDPFAMLCATADPVCDSILTSSSGSGMPVIGIRSQFAAEHPIDGHDLFYLFPEIAGEVPALAKYAQQHLDGPNVAGIIVRPAEPRWQQPVAATVADCVANGWSGLHEAELRSMADVAPLVDRIKRDSITVVIALGPSAIANALLHEIDRRELRPTILMPGELGEIEPLDIPPGLDGRIYLSYPTWVQSISRVGMETYTNLCKRFGLTSAYLRPQTMALAEAMIFVEALEKAGRDVTREKLVEQLEHLYEFETGLTPPVTYGPNRRTGTDEMYIVALGAGAASSNLVGRYVSARTRGNE